MDMQMSLEGLRGEVFNHEGKVGATIPPEGREGAIPFKVLKVWPPGRAFPAWADMVVAGRLCRINPNICLPPYHRLADCVMIAHFERAELSWHGMAVKVTLPPPPHPNAQDFLFWRTKIGGEEVVMIDTAERVEQYSKPPTEYHIGDGIGRLAWIEE